MSQTKEEGLSLGNIKNGAAIEKFDTILAEVMVNIHDPNTEPTDVREITLKVAFKPDEDRFLTAIGFQCWANKLAKHKPVVTQAAMDVDRNGEITVKEILPAQKSLFPATETQMSQSEKVTPIQKGE